MAVSYKKLWKLLIDKNMKKKDLRAASGISTTTLAKLGKDENVSTEILSKICAALNCDVGDIMEMVPVGVLGRPGQQVAAGLAPAARRFAAARVEPSAARGLADMQPPAWTLLTGPMVDLSSSEIRARGGWR